MSACATDDEKIKRNLQILELMDPGPLFDQIFDETEKMIDEMC